MKKKKDGFHNQILIVIPDTIQQQLKQDKLTEQFYLTDIGFFPKAPKHFVSRPQGISEYVFIYCHSGSGWFQLTGDEKVELKAGEYCVLPANVAHAYGSSQVNTWSIYWLHFTGAQATNFYENLAQGFLEKAHSASQFNLDLFRMLMLNMEKMLSFSNVAQASMTLWALLGDIIFQNNAQNNNTLEEAMNFIRSNLHKNLSLNDIAIKVGLDPVRFSQLFKQQYATTPIDYLIHLRIQRACKYLQFSDLKINEIAKVVSYTDQYYFSRVFSKFIGISPRQYRKKYNN